MPPPPDKADLACRHQDPGLADAIGCFLHRIDVVDSGINASMPFHLISTGITIALIFLTLHMLFQRRLAPVVGLAALAIGLAIGPEWLIWKIFSALVEDLHPRLARANVELYQLLLLSGLVVVLGLTQLRARWRSRDRAIIAITGAIVAATTMWFQFLFINGAMFAAFRDNEMRMLMAAELPEAIRDRHCQALGLNCGIIQSDGNGQDLPVAGLRLNAADNIRQEITRHRAMRHTSLPHGEYWFSWTNTEKDTGGPFSALYRETADGRALLMLDATWSQVPYAAGSIIFKIQIGIAHAVWFFGGLVLIHWHHRLPQRGRRPANADGDSQEGPGMALSGRDLPPASEVG